MTIPLARGSARKLRSLEVALGKEDLLPLRTHGWGNFPQASPSLSEPLCRRFPRLESSGIHAHIVTSC